MATISGKEFFGGKVGRVIQPINAPVQEVAPESPTRGAFGSAVTDTARKTGQFFSGFARGAGKAFDEGRKEIQGDISKQATKFKQAESGATIKGQKQRVGALARGGMRTVANVLETAFAVPIQGAVEGISEIDEVQQLASDPRVSKALDIVGQGMSKVLGPIAQRFEEYAAANPEKSEDFKDVFEILTSLIGEKPAQKALEEISATSKQFIDEGGDVLKRTFQETGDLASDLKNFAVDTKNKLTSVVGDKAKLRSTFTNLDEEIYRRVENPEYAQKVKTNLEVLEQGNTNPYFNLAQNIGEKVNTAWQEAKTFFGETAKKYVAQGTKYDVGARLKEIIDKVDAFKTGKDIRFDVVRGKDGKIKGYKLQRGRYSPYTGEEIGNLNRLIEDIMSARDVNADELLALDQKFGAYYNAVNPSTPTAYHAAVMELKSATQARIRELLSGDMKKAYEQYARLSNLKDDFGNKIVDAQGNLKPSAEQYLANLTNKNKGVAQLNAKEYQDLLGMDVVNEAQAITDAKKFMLTQAPSGGRLSDFLKSNIFTGLGAAGGGLVGGPVGAGVGAAGGAAMGTKFTSPKFVGKRAIEESLKKKP